jgi:hypothetical protein
MAAERVIRKRNFRWWSKFNYITSAALDSGTIISVLLIFLALQINGQSQLDWWGNRWFENSTSGLLSIFIFIFISGIKLIICAALDQIALDTPFALRDTPPEGFALSPKERLGY